jgi:hypothetical protein
MCDDIVEFTKPFTKSGLIELEQFKESIKNNTLIDKTLIPTEFFNKGGMSLSTQIKFLMKCMYEMKEMLYLHLEKEHEEIKRVIPRTKLSEAEISEINEMKAN